MSAARWLSASVLGLVLFAVPFLRYTHFGASAAPHTDHRPRNGGVLRMIGDHHLEVRRQARRVEVFVSDAVRNPIRPHSGSVTFAGSQRQPLRVTRDRLTAPDPDSEAELEIEVQLEDQTLLRVGVGVD